MRTSSRGAALGFILVLATPTAGCSLFYPTTRPMPAEWHRAAAPADPRTLIVLWPGRGDAPADFVAAGFVDLLRASAPGADVVAVDAHFGYYLEESVLERVREDVILPARAQGTQRVYLVGVSMGGLGVLMFHNEFPDDVDGVLALAPFLGDRPVLDEIRAAGGLGGFQPASPPPRQDYQRALWFGLRRQLDPAARPPVFLGFGTEDSFASACELLAEALPAERVFRAPGGHDWEPWRQTLEDALPRMLAEEKATPSAPLVVVE
jgi:S-formylglutathione hydrolase FrmB